MSKELIESQKDKKEILFRNSRREEQRRKTHEEDAFKLNNIVKNARETSDTPSSNSIRSNSVVNRAQLTPLKNQSYQKARGNFNFVEDKKRGKNDKLDPIGAAHDSRKYL